MSRITLIQPRHTYAPDHCDGAKGHIYMPTSLLTVAARLLLAGVGVSVYDENMSPKLFEAEIIGVNLLGAPYVERVRELRDRLGAGGASVSLVVGGQVVSGFRPEELVLLFGESVVNGNDDFSLAAALGMDARALPSPRQTSLIPAYELVDEQSMRAYLQEEFGFFLSQGCRFSCSFCAAHRTRRDPIAGEVSAVNEVYRAADIVEQDLLYLTIRAQTLGLNRLRIYLSNLDLFQSPDGLSEFLTAVEHVRMLVPAVSLEMRGLSTVHSFLEVHRSRPDLIERFVVLGLRRIGFGVDGVAPEVWRATKKPQSGSMCVDAIVIARKVYGITPENLMVFGHFDVDTEGSLSLAVEFTRAMLGEYGALPRPHVAKSVVPGNDGWYSPACRPIVEKLLAWPQGFQSLDFTALPSLLTHPDAGFREVATKYYLQACGIEGAITRYVLPETPDLDADGIRQVREFNQGKYDI